MKDNMVQELLLRAAMKNQNTPQQPPANICQGYNTLSNNVPNGGSALHNTLLKSLYLDNARNIDMSNIKNVNNFPAQNFEYNQNINPQGTSAFEEFIKNNPEFFKERETLLDYLSTCNSTCDIEELNKIAQIAKTLEEAAIKRFCNKNPKYAQFLQYENQKALDKLQNNSTGISIPADNFGEYTAEDVAKMSGKEFLENRDAIEAQVNAYLKNR